MTILPRLIAEVLRERGDNHPDWRAFDAETTARICALLTRDDVIEAMARGTYEYFRPIWLEKDAFEAKPWDEHEPGDGPHREMWRSCQRAAVAAVTGASEEG